MIIDIFRGKTETGQCLLVNAPSKLGIVPQGVRDSLGGVAYLTSVDPDGEFWPVAVKSDEAKAALTKDGYYVCALKLDISDQMAEGLPQSN